MLWHPFTHIIQGYLSGTIERYHREKTNPESDCLPTSTEHSLTAATRISIWWYLGWGVTKPISSVPLLSKIFSIANLLNITFIFGWGRRSSAAVTPVKYECDAKNLTGSLARSKILLTEKLTIRLKNPTPGALHGSYTIVMAYLSTYIRGVSR